MEIVFESERNIRFSVGANYIYYKRTKRTLEILGLYVAETFRRKKVATKLIYYSLRVLLDWYPSIKKVLVDDMSDHSMSLKHNVYRQFGFKGNVNIGPERVLKVNSLFYRYYLKKIWMNFI